MKNDIEFSATALDSKLEASNCAMLIDSFYANSGGSLKNLSTDCYLKEKNLVAAAKGGIEKTAFILNTKTQISQGKDLLKIQVNVQNIYEN